MVVTMTFTALDQLLWDDCPAQDWMTGAYPLGNGRLGAMVFGGVATERIQFNEATLWSGRPIALEPPGGDGSANLAKLRAMLAAGNRWREANEFANTHFVASGKDFGHYLPCGDLQLELPGHAAEPGSYRRELDLGQGLLRVAYISGGVEHRRTIFISRPAGVLVMHLACDRPGSLGGSLRLEAALPAGRNQSEGRLGFAGQVAGSELTFAAGVGLRIEGGRCQVAGDRLVFADASAVTVILTAATSYDPAAPGCIGSLAPATVVMQTLDRVESPVTVLQDAHVEDHRELAGRTGFTLVGSRGDAQPTRIRLAEAAAGTPDPGMAGLLFNFGRYLLIASSRPGGLPANLQGIWNQDLRPAWNCDWHANINVQMNYWPAEVANLAECHRPLIDWIDRLRVNGARVARQWYGCGGWVVHWASNPWLFCEPGKRIEWGLFLGATGWLSAHAWQAYEFSGDRADLERAWPILAQAATFYLDLVEGTSGGRWRRDGVDGESANRWQPDGSRDFLMVSPSVSPENGFDYLAQGGRSYVDAGSAIDQQICRELLSNTAAAAMVLDREPALRQRIAAVLPRLLPDAVAPDGRLQEWASPFDEPDPLHRHVSHLYALYPGLHIGVRSTPALAQAARASLLGRGDGGTGWARAWKMALWARLEDGERAHALFLSHLNPTTATTEDYGPKGGGTYPNLLCAHPPFQIDGNFGVAAAIVECLVQSHGGEVVLLPALPKAWAAGGEVRGLRLRSGRELDLAWNDGRVLRAVIRCRLDGELRVRVAGGESRNLAVRAGRSYACAADLRFSEQPP